jgi:leucyl aminopeptidase (aminopeptidase T)
MLNYDVEILVTTKSLSHTAARKNASKSGARITTLPGITIETMKRAIDVDYDKLKEMTSKISGILDKGNNVKITTEAGTDMNFSIKGREGQGDDAGIYDKKGSFGNLPSGEAFLAPVEKTCNGTYVVDASFGGIGKLNSPIKITVKNGYAVDFFGEDAEKLKEILEKFGKEAGNIAEFGIGTNTNAIITGNILEDEKVFGTCHIALGNNSGFGGKVDVPIHLDGIIKNPIIYVDNKKIMDDGKLIV